MNGYRHSWKPPHFKVPKDVKVFFCADYWKEMSFKMLQGVLIDDCWVETLFGVA